MTETDLIKYLISAIQRLDFVSGVAMGLAPKDRRDEILKMVKDHLAFTNEVRTRLDGIKGA